MVDKASGQVGVCPQSAPTAPWKLLGRWVSGLSGGGVGLYGRSVRTGRAPGCIAWSS